MKREPAVIFHRSNGTDEIVIHGTEGRARRNAAILGTHRATFTWIETETIRDRIRKRWAAT